MRNEDETYVQALIPLAAEGECLAHFSCLGMYRTGYCVIPDDMDVSRLDIAACLEDTLRRLLEWDPKDRPVEWQALSDDELVFAVLMAAKHWEDGALSDGSLPLDLGYEMPALTEFSRIPLTDRVLERCLYERYKFMWLMQNGTTMEELYDAMRSPDDPDFSSWEKAQVFFGRRPEDSYPDFTGFLEHEYQNAGEMRPCLLYSTERRLWSMDQPDREGGNDRFPGNRAFPCDLCREVYGEDLGRCDACFWRHSMLKEDAGREGQACYNGHCLMNRLTVCTARCANNCQYRNKKA